MDFWSWRIWHYLGAYPAVLGGLDGLVFAGGIGENSAEGRALCVLGLEFALVVTRVRLRDSHPGEAGDGAADRRAGQLPTVSFQGGYRSLPSLSSGEFRGINRSNSRH